MTDVRAPTGTTGHLPQVCDTVPGPTNKCYNSRASEYRFDRVLDHVVRLSYGDFLADSSRLVNDLRPLLILVKLMFYLLLRHQYMLCMGRISASGAPSTLKSQRCDGGVGSTPFRWAARAHALVGFGLSFSLCSSRFRARPHSMFLSRDEQQEMPLSEQDEPENLR